MRVRSRDAERARVVHVPLPRKRGRRATPSGEQGKPGARCTRSRACRIDSTRVSHHRSTGTPGLPCAMVLTAYFALSLVTGLCCHHRPCDAKHHHELDASVGASGPHAFAVRAPCHSSFDIACVHRIPRPTSVTIAKRPSCGCGMAIDMQVSWVRSEPKYFCEEGWTASR